MPRGTNSFKIRARPFNSNPLSLFPFPSSSCSLSSDEPEADQQTTTGELQPQSPSTKQLLILTQFFSLPTLFCSQILPKPLYLFGTLLPLCRRTLHLPSSSRPLPQLYPPPPNFQVLLPHHDAHLPPIRPLLRRPLLLLLLLPHLHLHLRRLRRRGRQAREARRRPLLPHRQGPGASNFASTASSALNHIVDVTLLEDCHPDDITDLDLESLSAEVELLMREQEEHSGGGWGEGGGRFEERAISDDVLLLRREHVRWWAKGSSRRCWG